MATIIGEKATAPRQEEQSISFGHLADYAVACNRIVCGLRHPRDRIFQIGGRRRLLFASAVAMERFDANSGQDDNQARHAIECEILADLAVAVADGVFRQQGDKTALRLLTFLVNRLNKRWTLGDQTWGKEGDAMQQALSNADRSTVQRLLGGFLDHSEDSATSNTPLQDFSSLTRETNSRFRPHDTDPSAGSSTSASPPRAARDRADGTASSSPADRSPAKRSSSPIAVRRRLN
jgi:hypothetical protein